ncbi:ATP-binding protein [Salinisphaera sp. SPP-AMP-43]|uniref:ATP-binding protein n=1 Tax=Salinisphaera sp. SPP-AMP-43 TaxID=3121288 RepID=UPI003C6E3C13
MSRAEFPFAAVVGQDRLKTALILAAIEPGLAGVLISGPRGAAKSTLARGLAAIDRPAAGRFVTLPLGATEEQVIGSLDLERALGAGALAYRPGVIGRAHGGYLYIDEVNLLADPLVDVLLDVAASKVNRIERDGISREHAAEFVLIGTMNPEEGELRPQFADRFGLCVVLEPRYSAAERRAIVDQRLAYDRDPAAFERCWADAQAELAERIDAARTRLTNVACAEAIQDAIAERCVAADVEGVRADLHWRQAACAHAAWQGRDRVADTDIDAVAEFVLCHRRNAEQPPADATGGSQSSPPDGGSGANGANDSSEYSNDSDSQDTSDWGGLPPRHVGVALARSIDEQAIGAVGSGLANHSARQRSSGSNRRGAVPALSGHPGPRIDWPRTLARRALDPSLGPPKPRDRSDEWTAAAPVYRPARASTPVLHCVLLDTSASTLGGDEQSTARAAVAGLAERALRQRERFAVLTFGGDRIDWLLPPGRAPRCLETKLARIPAGGGTPLGRALATGRDRLQQLARREPALCLRSYVFTDGRSRDPVNEAQWPGQLIVIDTERARVPLGRARRLAARLGGEHRSLADFLAGSA